MTDPPPLQPEAQQFVPCPFCTMQIPADAAICPHCRKILPPGEKLLQTYGGVNSSTTEGFRKILPGGHRLGRLSDIWIRYGKWIKVAGPALAGLALLFLTYGIWVDYKVNIVAHPDLPMEARKDKRDRMGFLTVYVTNRGEDIPDLSLRSVGVVVEFVFRDGRREKKTVFPKTEHHGEGAMLRGETGKYEIAIPSRGLKEVVLRSEIVDLGMGRTLVPPGVRRKPAR